MFRKYINEALHNDYFQWKMKSSIKNKTVLVDFHVSSVKRKSMIWNADCADDADARGLDYPCKSA